ncbi:glycosyltransferase [bacterium]|nr:glycosyltransferase [bacterium]
MSTSLPAVVIDAERLKHPYCGLGQFSRYLGRALIEACAERFDPVFLLPWPSVPAEADLQPTRSIRAYPWRREDCFSILRPVVPWRLCRQPALWHTTHQQARYLPTDPRVPVVLTIHDLNFLREKSGPKIKRNLDRVQRLVDRASVVTTISQFVAEELHEHLNLRGQPPRVIYNGLSLDANETGTRPSFVTARPFLFAIGTVYRKKNFHVLVDLAARLPEYDLVIAGTHHAEYVEQIRQLARQAQLDDRLILPGGVSEQHRQWLYHNCAAFLFPSLTEGFGLPAIEAMSCGRPVFLSRLTSLPEVGGPLAFYWDSFEPDEMTRVFQQGMATFQSDPTYAEQLRRRADQFRWENAARQYVDLYQETLDAANRQREHCAA